jgi:DMSO/TMAO reductase YedYZ molybdopterin-dependent catalytic subunit
MATRHRSGLTVRHPAARRTLAGIAGLLAAAVALGVAELVAGVIGVEASPVVAVGNAVVALTPEPVKAFGIRTFGGDDKRALIIGTLVLLALYAIGTGLVALRDLRIAQAGIGLFGFLGIAAAVTRPAGSALDGVPSFAGAVAGILALRLLIGPLDRLLPDDGAAEDDEPGVDRRGFLQAAGIALGAAALGGGGGRLLERRFAVASERNALRLPRPASPAPRLPAGADLAPGVPGLTPLVTSSREFYRVDTAITLPQIAPEAYRLTVAGLVARPRTYTLDDLLHRGDLIERDVTLTCVSNEVGGVLAGNARWLGVPLGAFLREIGVAASSTQLVCRSHDGMTIGAATRAALETPGAMLAVGMNGRPLPVAHGFPVRMIIPGQYGYVSACKWLTSIEATTFDAFDAYWVRQGWATEGPIRLASRIDTPASGRSFAAGRRPIAGVAWAQTRGIARVEVQVDDRPWVDARLSPDADPDVWRQWVLPYDFARGTHRLTVRATAADGEVQTARRADPYPAGATGWHSVTVVAT